ncbi:unnamed protein product [Soboliphyme baturini]|uniref:Carbonic anhydrase n=1 Tax=Soboliphyme baturini TaxID=241478 RepID=A0A183IP20_9BILA|nr:unnamed protein product [Soboliphyme baturini]
MTPDKGSEHTVNGAAFAGEVHLVHRHVKMNSRDKPLQDDEGYAVLAVFLKETDEDNPVLQPLIELIACIKHKNDFESFPTEGYDLTHLIPGRYCRKHV